MPSIETGQQRRERMKRNRERRGPLNRRIHNNRKGQPQRFHRQQAAGSSLRALS